MRIPRPLLKAGSATGLGDQRFASEGWDLAAAAHSHFPTTLLTVLQAFADKCTSTVTGAYVRCQDASCGLLALDRSRVEPCAESPQKISQLRATDLHAPGQKYGAIVHGLRRRKPTPETRGFRAYLMHGRFAVRQGRMMSMGHGDFLQNLLLRT